MHIIDGDVLCMILNMDSVKLIVLVCTPLEMIVVAIPCIPVKYRSEAIRQQRREAGGMYIYSRSGE